MSEIKHPPWTDYATERPATEGVYEWRVPSIAVPGAVVILAAHMRKRGAGYKDVISPVFDYWDGYRVHVPLGLQWRSTESHSDLKSYDQRLLGVEGLDHCECIYCGKKPRLHAVQAGRDGGVIVSGSPQHLSSWWLNCCSWGKTPHLSDPREIERIRRAAIDKARGQS
ncbi:hypothetical protein [Paraburkholderia phenoliruptrix]|uniref:hypothetical protein n=1 Tax=Paraburkholderia phenoliruptrix TaxID=252970 RepID=UPI002854217E|nr:hypothetical protein [Paraburkholderia phenoliruptrix]MDR6393484.1 hypothetical protein [Paraburkholderia phenoliruptrix]